MNRFIISLLAVIVGVSGVTAQPAPSYSKQIRPLITKYCLECHNAKTQKGTLSLETHKAMMEGADAGPVIVPGQPDKSKLVLLTEHKQKPTMPPAKAKYQPTKDEVALLRAWVKDGARDDGADFKVVLPTIEPKVDVLAPVTGLAYEPKSDGYPSSKLWIARQKVISTVDFAEQPVEKKKFVTPMNVTAIHGEGIWAMGGGLHFLRLDVSIGKHSDEILDLASSVRIGPVRFASAGYDSQIHIHTLVNWKLQTAVLKEHSDAVYGLAFNPDGTMLASVSADRAMKVFDVEKGKLLYTLGEATDWLYAIAWSPDGKYLVSGGVDKSIRVYEPTRTGAKLRQSVFAHEGAVQKLVFTSDSKTLYSVGEDRVVKAWDIEKMVERKVYDKQPETVMCLALREDAGQFIVGRYDGIVQLIDMKSGKVAHEFGRAKEGEKGRKGEGEKKPAPSPQASATSLRGQTPPVTDIAGSLDRAGAVNVHRFDAKKGQPLGIQLTKDAKSKLDPVLTITDSAGRIVATGFEGHLGYTFTQAGRYAIGVRDREYRGGADFKYQLKLGEIPVVTSVFPMGMMRGENGHIHLEGVFLPKKSIPMSIPADAKPGQVIALPVGAGVLGKAQIVVGELPEVIAGGKMQVNSTANGRIINDNQRDVWTFKADKGQRLIVEVNARRIGSRLDSIIEILDKNDQPVPRAVLRSQAKTNVTFRDHDSAQGNIRIETWSELGINDFLYIGNELMKIKELPTHPDADCNFFATDGKRLGYLDTTPTHHANGTPMYKVNVHPPGTAFPPNGFPVFTLYYKNDDGGPGYGRDSRIIFDPPADGEYKVRIADARGMGGANFGYRLTVRPPRPSFEIRATPTTPMVHNFGGASLSISVDRIDGYDGPIDVRFENLPPGFSAPSTRIEAGAFSTAVTLYAQVNAPSALPKLPMKVIGEAIIDGKKQIKESAGLNPQAIPEGELRTWTDVESVDLKPGGQSKLLVQIERMKGFKGRVPLEVRGLPHGVRVLDIGLNGILVNENETSRTVVLYAEPWVQAQDHPIVVLAKREGKNTEHAAKAVMLRVK
ncbi:MAG: hypothetical protein HY289_11495 [Planctomycetes bacterium]|nr:hypothetical protein [Planctomycetota bacterium]